MRPEGAVKKDVCTLQNLIKTQLSSSQDGDTPAVSPAMQCVMNLTIQS